jgi:hypothetical protein
MSGRRVLFGFETFLELSAYLIKVMTLWMLGYALANHVTHMLRMIEQFLISLPITTHLRSHYTTHLTSFYY